MKNSKTFSAHQNPIVPLSEKLRWILTSIRTAESALEYEMAVRDLEKVAEEVERLEEGDGA